MKISVFLLIVSIFLLLSSCDKDTSEGCYQVKYVTAYCPKTGASLVQFTKKIPEGEQAADGDGKTVYQAALLDVPEAFQVRDTIFYVKYHYDPDRADLDGNICPDIFGTTLKVLVCDYSSDKDCSD